MKIINLHKELKSLIVTSLIKFEMYDTSATIQKNTALLKIAFEEVLN